MFLASGMKKAAKNSLLDHKGSKAVLKTSDFVQVCCPNPQSVHENALNCRLQYKYQSVAHIFYLAVTTYSKLQNCEISIQFTPTHSLPQHETHHYFSNRLYHKKKPKSSLGFELHQAHRTQTPTTAPTLV